MRSDDPTSIEPLAGAITLMGSGRLGPTLSALVALGGAVLGGLALSRARRSSAAGPGGAVGSGLGATVAVVFGAASTLLGALFLATADGGPGTGNGVVASVGAVVLGPVAVVLGALGRAAHRRSTSAPVGELAHPASAPR